MTSFGSRIIYNLGDYKAGDCPACDRKRYTSFNWKFARSGNDFDLSIIVAQLTHIKSLKFGDLYQCKMCHGNWYLDADGLTMERVPKERIELLHAWDGIRIVPSTETINVLRHIGGTESDRYGNGKGSIRFPCSIETLNRESSDLALVSITKEPPIADWQKAVLLGSDVRAITPSSLALPLDVRVATHNAHEVSMGFAPTVIQSRDGQRFVVNWANYFFLHGSTIGSDISRAIDEFDHHDCLPVVGQPLDQIVYVYFDWFDDCERLVEQRLRNDR